jgi:hypothetical protein
MLVICSSVFTYLMLQYAQVELAHGGRGNSSSFNNSGGGGRRGGVSRHTEYRGMILNADFRSIYKCSVFCLYILI